MLGGEPDAALRRMLTRAEGQPFLLTELLRGLREENSWQLTAPRRNWP